MYVYGIYPGFVHTIAHRHIYVYGVNDSRVDMCVYVHTSSCFVSR